MSITKRIIVKKSIIDEMEATKKSIEFWKKDNDARLKREIADGIGIHDSFGFGWADGKIDELERTLIRLNTIYNTL